MSRYEDDGSVIRESRSGSSFVGMNTTDDDYVDISNDGYGGTNTSAINDEIIAEPVFEFKSEAMNLKYNKFFPFIGAYLIYKFLWKV
jgi:hypothetical protein